MPLSGASRTKQTPSGRFLRITEKCGGKTNVVIVPDTGINEFNTALDAVIAEVMNAKP